MSTSIIPPHLEQFVTRQRHAHLASTDARGAPHVVPVVFAYVDGLLYVPIDAKPKSVGASRLKRIRNLQANPRAAFLVDRYADDWRQLCFLLIHAEAQVI